MPFFSRKKQQPGPVCTWSAHGPQSGPSPSPFPRRAHTLTATVAGELLLFGGWAQGAANSDLYNFSTRDFSTTLLQTSGEVPSPRYAHGAALIGTTLLIYGGHTTIGDQNELNHDSVYLLNLVSREWTRVAVNGPGPGSRWYYTTTVVGSKLFVLGGRNDENVFFNDMWTLDLNCLKSRPLWESYEPTPGNEKPLPRAGHVSVTTEDRIIVFGGRSDQHRYNDTWSFDISTRKWTELQCTGSIPSPRSGHAAVLVDDVMYVFGGYTGKTELDDLYALQLSTQRWFKFDNMGKSPHRKSNHAMASDGTRVFVLGGDSGSAQSDKIFHVFDTKDSKYSDPESNAVNPNEKSTQLAWKSYTGPPTQEQSQHRKSSSSEAHGASRLQNATPADSGLPATLERNPDPNDRPSESEPKRVPEDDVREGSTEYHAKFVGPHSASKVEVARLELERQLSVSLAVQAERGHRIAQLTDELALKSALLEQAEANATEAAMRAEAVGLEQREHADRLLMQTSLVEQRDAELVDMQARLDELLLSRDQQVGNRNLEVASQDLRSQFSDSQTTVQRLESENKRITRELNKSREAADQHRNENERLKNGMEELKADHETAIAQARRQAGSLQRDKSDLQQSLDTARPNRRLPRMGSPMTPEGRERSDLLTPNDREMDDVFSPAPSTSRRRGDTSVTFSADGDFNSSPDVSPSRPIQAPNHPSNEVKDLPQYERELTNVRAKLEAKESELEAVRLRLTDAEKGLTKSKAEADILRAQTATGSVNRDEDQVTRRLMERMRALEAEVTSKRWNEKSIEEMECRNEGF